MNAVELQLTMLPTSADGAPADDVLMVEEDQEGSLPVQVPGMIFDLTRFRDEGKSPWESVYASPADFIARMLSEAHQGNTGPSLQDEVLRTITPGTRRLRIFCPKRLRPGLRLQCNGQAKRIGARRTSIQEAVQFQGSRQQRLRFPYDRPSPTVEYQSAFLDSSGKTTKSLPKYDPRLGGYVSDQDVTGAMVVSYEVEYGLWEISYDSGRSGARNNTAWRKMQEAWMTGAPLTLPPLTVIVTTGHLAQLVSFQREVMPRQAQSEFAWSKVDGGWSGVFTEKPGTRKTETVSVKSSDGMFSVPVRRTTSYQMASENGQAVTMNFLSGQSNGS